MNEIRTRIKKIKRYVPDTIEAVPIRLAGVPERVVARDIYWGDVRPIERRPEQLLRIVAHTRRVNLHRPQNLVPFRSKLEGVSELGVVKMTRA
jgi:hypothetical protein